MATQWGDPLKIAGLVASGDLSAKQYCVVKPASTAGAVILSSSNTSKVIGVLLNDPTNGQAAEIAVLGPVKAKLAAGVAAGDLLMPDTTGYLKTAATANNRVVGYALEASGGAGYIHPIVLTGGSNF